MFWYWHQIIGSLRAHDALRIAPNNARQGEILLDIRIV